MSESKVTIPKDLADAIERTQRYDLSLIMRNGINTPESDYGTIRKWLWYLNDDPTDRIKAYFAALVNGYEVERTPHDKLREHYHRIMAFKHDKERFSYDYALYDGGLAGIKDTLDILGIAVEGINAPQTKEASAACR